MERQEIFATKASKVFAPEHGFGQCSPQILATAIVNLKELGFGVSRLLFDAISTSNDETVAAWYEELIPSLRQMVGAHRHFRPMYPNFPKQVMETSDAELYINALIHYWGSFVVDVTGNKDLVLLPHYNKEEREQLEEWHKLRWLDLGTQKEFDAIFTHIASANSSISKTDKEILSWFIKNYGVHGIETLVPDTIQQKETLAFLISKLGAPAYMASRIKTATDILRVAVAMSNGDISLSSRTKFRTFSKPERRFFLTALEQIDGDFLEDMLRYKTEWKRLGEKLHPGDYYRRYRRVYNAFDVLRNNKPYLTFNAKVEEALIRRDTDATVALLKQRPGDFARRLDHVLRTHDNAEQVIDTFLSVAARVSTPVLFQLWHHFEYRDPSALRVFFPKGSVAKAHVAEKDLPKLPRQVNKKVSDGIRKVLKDRFSNLPALGKVYVGLELSDIILPSGQRSTSRALETVARGSSFRLDRQEGDTVRFFLWWKNGEDRTDIDLSAMMLSEDFHHISDITYYNLKHEAGCHSGDITNAPTGACEFIDVDLNKLQKMGIRYVLMNVVSYSGQSFEHLPECFAGWMLRNKPQSGEVFDARTVQNKVDLASDSKSYIPMILDVQQNRFYWVDMAGHRRVRGGNIANQSDTLSLLARSIMEMNRPNLYDLFLMHAEARGSVVETKEEADFTFALREADVTAFMTDTILSEYLA